MPMFASGHRPQYSLMRDGSVVASLKPCGVSGSLPRGLHGKTGTLCFAYSNAAARSDVSEDFASSGLMLSPFLGSGPAMLLFRDEAQN